MNLFGQANAVVRHGGIVADIGPGIRPQEVVRADVEIFVEPFGPYADRLELPGRQVIRMTAIEWLRTRPTVDTVVFLDVIEHMEKDVGAEVIELASDVAQQVVVFTPLGFVEQDGDAWEMGGEFWQKHRSGWMPHEFGDDWIKLVDEYFHFNQKHGAFFAILKK